MPGQFHRRKRRDTNHKAIVEALRAAGASVVDLSQVGRGCPDLLVGRGGVTRLLEVKEPGGKLNHDQVDFIARWRGTEVRVVTTPEDALRAVGALPDVPPPY